MKKTLIATVALLAASAGLQAQNPNIAIKIADHVNNQNSSSEGQHVFGTATLNLNCPVSPTAKLSSTPDGANRLLVDNFINLTVNPDEGEPSPQNVCNIADGAHDSFASCFQGSYESAAAGLIGQDPDTYAATYGVDPFSITGFFGEGFEGGPITLKFDLVDFGGLVGSTNLYLVTTCTQNTDTPAPQSTQVSTTQTSTIPFNNDAFNYSAQLNTGSPTTATVNPILMEQADCDLIIQPTFPGAHCFVYKNAGGSNTDKAVLLELTCPQLSANGDCTPFDAELGSNFDIILSENPGFTPNPANPYPGWLKGHGPIPSAPCTQNTGNSPALFQSNQIDSFVFSRIDPFTKGGSGGTGSCWVATYNTPGEVPTVSVTAPANGGVYQLGQNDATTKAAYTCTAVNNTGPTGPYLTPTSCTATDTPGGTVASGAQFDTATPGPHTFIATMVDSATDSAASSPVHYTVLAPSTDLAIAELGPLAARTGSNVTYTIGVGDLGSANATNVTITDLLPPGTSFVKASGSREVCTLNRLKLNCTVTTFTCTQSSGTVSCNAGTITPLSLVSLNGATVQVTVKITAVPPAKKTITITNKVSVSSDNADPKPANNNASFNTIVTN